VKYVSEEHLVTWWQSFSETDVVSFFGMLEVSLHFFKYAGLRNVTVVRTPDAESAKPKPKKAHTLPARINPSEITHENTGTLVIHTNRENLIDSGKCLFMVCNQLSYQFQFPQKMKFTKSNRPFSSSIWLLKWASLP